MTEEIYYQKIKAELESNNAKKIISAAKQLQKKYIPEFEDMLVDILEKRYSTNKSWEVQAELLNLMGKECIVSAFPIVKEIVAKNLEFDMVTNRAATAFLRMSRTDLSDVNPIISMLGNIGYSVGEGFLTCLGIDFMIPPTNNQNLLISYFWDFGNPLPFGYVDPRFGLAQAAENWNTPKAIEFIRHCIDSSDPKLKTFALKILSS